MRGNKRTLKVKRLDARGQATTYGRRMLFTSARRCPAAGSQVLEFAHPNRVYMNSKIVFIDTIAVGTQARFIRSNLVNRHKTSPDKSRVKHRWNQCSWLILSCCRNEIQQQPPDYYQAQLATGKMYECYDLVPSAVVERTKIHAAAIGEVFFSA
jgi:hypothetical protein